MTKLPRDNLRDSGRNNRLYYSGLFIMTACLFFVMTAGLQAVDRIELEGTSITGNRELPKVLYIVPWKKAPVGDLVGRPVESLLDEVLAPLDRDVFRRQVEYHKALSSK